MNAINFEALASNAMNTVKTMMKQSADSSKEVSEIFNSAANEWVNLN